MNLTLIDCDPISYICGFTYRDADYSYMLQQVDSMMNNILSATQADVYLGFLGGEKCFRHAVAVTKTYKGTRSKEQPEWLQQWKKPICEHLMKEWGVLVVDGIEADDALSICHSAYKKEYQVTVASPDKDLRQLEGLLFDFKKWEHYLSSPEDAARHFWTSVLCGDVADNISGLPGCGTKGAEKILQDCTSEQEMADAVFAAYCSKKHIPAFFIEQYILLKMLDKPAFGFAIPAPLPVKLVEAKTYTASASTSSFNNNLLSLLGID